MIKLLEQFHAVVRQKWFFLILVNIVFAASALFWIFLIPYNKAPDENNHFRYTVKFIMENRRLPVCGVDDVECFRNAASSYNKFPALNYLAAAGGAALAREWDLKPYIGARLVSLLFGLIFVNALFAAGRRVTQSVFPAALAIAIAGLIPQVIFVCSYVNADSYALAVSGILALGVARVLCTPQVPGSKRLVNWSDALIVGVGLGLLFTAKLNYWIYLPWLGVGGLGLIATGRLSWNSAGRLVLTAIIMTIILAGFWYWRNFRLYGELLPMAPTSEWLTRIGAPNSPPRQTIAPRLCLPAIMELVRRSFFTDTLGFFYGRFGYGTVGFDPQVYALLKFIAPASAALFAVAAVTTRDRAIRVGLLWLVGLAATNMFLLMLYAVVYDYQPQGRYLFPLLAPVAVWMAWSIGRHPRLLKYALPLLLINLWLLPKAHFLLAGHY